MKRLTKFKVAAVQAAPVYLDLEGTVNKVCDFIDEAGKNGAKLVAFPEGFIPGYPFFAFVGGPEYAKQFYVQLYKNAVKIPSFSVQRISEAARRNKIYVCVSMSELDGGSLYLTQLWFNSKGDIIGKHRKMRVTSGERLVWGDGDASMMGVHETEIGNLGGLMCWEHQVPLDLCAMNFQNEQIHVASWPGFFPDELSSRYYAVSTQTYVLMCASLITDEMRKKICLNKEAHKIFDTFTPGHTCIYAPDGEPISELVPEGKEGIAYAEVDLDKIIEYKYYIDPAGHYSNPCLSMNFDRRPKKVLKAIGEKVDSVIPYEEINKFQE
ncbi:carbon-nitrogen hydrolase family protein [Clostridium massiliamazoniense]|uniref:carbon-nitrogen hydrolase family protein n=1 Tax=Clostridium massiliamazoniense TaxID=1347366 RepID=UPI0006D85E41|nr:carbon-nitrogen hydrolase family protein [Clostridium massiliamazoniense]